MNDISLEDKLPPDEIVEKTLLPDEIVYKMRQRYNDYKNLNKSESMEHTWGQWMIEMLRSINDISEHRHEGSEW